MIHEKVSLLLTPIIIMDKSWISLLQSSPQYLVGLNKFLNFAFMRVSVQGKIVYPCEKCKFERWKKREEVFTHCKQKQFPRVWGAQLEDAAAAPTTNKTPRRREQMSRSGPKTKTWDMSGTLRSPKLRAESSDRSKGGSRSPLLRFEGRPCFDIHLRLRNSSL